MKKKKKGTRRTQKGKRGCGEKQLGGDWPDVRQPTEALVEKKSGEGTGERGKRNVPKKKGYGKGIIKSSKGKKRLSYYGA